MYNTVANISKTADKLYVTGIFPRILYANSPSNMRSPGAQKYAQILWDKCIASGELEVHYLSHFDVAYLFNRLLRAYTNPSFAYEEAKLILINLENILSQPTAFKCYFRDSPQGLDMTIPLGPDQDDVFLPIRNRESQGVGAVRISSPELEAKFKTLFEAACDRSVCMNDNHSHLIKRFNNQLNKVYSQYTKKSEKKS